jgi:hypothetical protein
VSPQGSYLKDMTVDAIKEAIRQLPEPDRRELADWFEEELLPERPEEIHQQIGLGLSQLDRGEGISGEQSRAKLQDKKAAWLAQQHPRS